MAEPSTKPARGRAVILGNITVAEPRAGRNTGHDLHTYERAVLVTFDSLEAFQEAVKHGLIHAPAFEEG
jgi:hypothetical protein